MIGFKLLPLLFVSGIAMHSKDDIKARLGKLTGSFERTTNSQRMGAILYAMQLEITASDEGRLEISNETELRQFIRRKVKIKGKPNADSSLDVWGTPFKFRKEPQNFTLMSAGPDKRSSTKDDEVMSQNLYDY